MYCLIIGTIYADVSSNFSGGFSAEELILNNIIKQDSFIKGAYGWCASKTLKELMIFDINKGLVII